MVFSRPRLASAPAVYPVTTSASTDGTRVDANRGGGGGDGGQANGQARERRPSRRPSIAAFFSRRPSMAVEAPEIRTAPEKAWDELYGIIKKLPKPDPEATPPVTLDGIRRTALRKWMASSNPDMGGGQAERGEAGAGGDGVAGLNEYQVEFFMCMMEKVKALQFQEAKGKADDMYTALSISYGDMGTDIAVGAQLLNSAHPEQGIITFCILGWALFAQAVTATLMGQGLRGIVASLFGGKPIYDTYHAVAETPMSQSQQYDHDTLLMVTHVIEVCYESVPLGLYTTVLLVQAPAEERSMVQMMSVLASVLAIAFMTATSARDKDFHPVNRREQSQIIGWFPSDPWPQTVTFVSLNLFIGGVFTAKMTSLAVLFTASATVGTAWLVSEWLVLLALRMAAYDWRGHAQGADSVAFSLVMHLWEWIMLTAVPAPMVREPQFLGPAVYAAGVVYSLSINFAQVTVAFHIDDGEARVQMLASTVYAIVATSVGVAMVGAALIWAMMEPRYRKTFYQHRTMRTYLTEWHCTLATHCERGVGRDANFAEVVGHYSPYHWPAPEMLRVWLAQWPEWERAADPPPWFTREWQQHALGVVPPELLPEEVRPRSTATSSRRYR